MTLKVSKGIPEVSSEPCQIFDALWSSILKFCAKMKLISRLLLKENTMLVTCCKALVPWCSSVFEHNVKPICFEATTVIKYHHSS